MPVDGRRCFPLLIAGACRAATRRTEPSPCCLITVAMAMFLLTIRPAKLTCLSLTTPFYVIAFEEGNPDPLQLMIERDLNPNYVFQLIYFPLFTVCTVPLLA